MKLPLLLLATTTCTGSNSVSDTATVVHFEPPVALRGGPGQRQARSTNTMGLFHLGGDNALFQEFTVDYYPYQNRTALLFSSDSGRTWAQPPGGDAYDSLSCKTATGLGCGPWFQPTRVQASISAAITWFSPHKTTTTTHLSRGKRLKGACAAMVARSKWPTARCSPRIATPTSPRRCRGLESCAGDSPDFSQWSE